MKTYFTCTMLVLFSTFTKAQLKTPDLSPQAKITQTVGLTEVEIVYSRPSVKNRVIFGKQGILPFGEFWRLGANSATTITFNTQSTIAGEPLEKGTYTMLVKPYESSWEFSLYPHSSTNWNEYVNQTPLHSFSATVKNLTDLQESFEISIQDITSESANLEFQWEFAQVSIPIKVATTKAVMKNISSTMAGPSLNDYFKAALFMHENGQDLPRALTYIQKVTATEEALFFTVYREALILKDLAKNKEALVAAQRALKLSNEAKNNDFIRLCEMLIATL